MEQFTDVELPEPEVEDWLLPAWRCWHRLNLDRPWYGGGLGPMVPGRIPWRDIRDWAEFHMMTGEGALFLDACIRAMDGTYLEFHASRARHAAAPKSKIIRP